MSRAFGRLGGDLERAGLADEAIRLVDGERAARRGRRRHRRRRRREREHDQKDERASDMDSIIQVW